MPRNSEKAKWLLSCSKNQTINIEWQEDNFKSVYTEFGVHTDDTAEKLTKLEEQRVNGIDILE